MQTVVGGLPENGSGQCARSTLPVRPGSDVGVHERQRRGLRPCDVVPQGRDVGTGVRGARACRPDPHLSVEIDDPELLLSELRRDVHLRPALPVHSDRVEGRRDANLRTSCRHVLEILQSAIADGLVGCPGQMSRGDVDEVIRTVDLAQGGDEFHSLLLALALLSVEDGLLLPCKVHGPPMPSKVMNPVERFRSDTTGGGSVCRQAGAVIPDAP